jgi:hypothetical protein
MDKRRDRLFLAGDELHHLLIANHKVRGTCIFVDKQSVGSELQGLRKQSTSADVESWALSIS